ncbi:unnamed protein product [Mytilus edulis]|uniref:RNB domain-containing protein n=1 Tax=Mytilus edulis TaxID=6550 RepID=A0A8S3UQY5_MYTED|nr:unnamed protein product [Mytilus edulis]
MAFELASNFVKLMSKLPEDSRPNVYSLISRLWLISARCHYRVVSIKKKRIGNRCGIEKARNCNKNLRAYPTVSGEFAKIPDKATILITKSRFQKLEELLEQKIQQKSGSLPLPSFAVNQSSKFDMIQRWRNDSRQAFKRHQYQKGHNRSRKDSNEEKRFSEEEYSSENMSDVSSMSICTTRSMAGLSADEFSGSEYDISDSGSDWCSSASDFEKEDDNIEEKSPEEPTYFQRSLSYHSGQFRARNILEKEYFQKGLDLSDECIESVGTHYFKGKRILYRDISNKNFDDQCRMLPKIYKRCTISIESAHQAVCTPVEPTDEIQEIQIIGRSKCGQTFTDDTVVVQIHSKQIGGKVHGEVVSFYSTTSLQGYCPSCVCMSFRSKGRTFDEATLLLPNQKKPVISVYFKFDQKGNVSKSKPTIQKSIIKSCKQFTYQEVQNILDDKLEEQTIELVQDVKMLYKLSQSLKEDRLGHASFSWPVEIDVSENENPMDTYQAHSLVEEFMLLTNSSIAQLLRRQYPGSVPLLCQQPPANEVFDNWYNVNKHYIHHIFGLQSRETPRGTISVSWFSFRRRTRKLTPVQTWVLEEIKDLVPETQQNITRIKQLIQSDFLHPKQALAYHEWNLFQESSKYVCSTEILANQDKGIHFSLEKRSYVHFTSPLRRYSDLIIHRLVSAMLKKHVSPYEPQEISDLCSHK